MMQSIFFVFYAISLYLVVKKKSNFVYLIPIFNLLSDMSFSFFEGFSITTYLRAIILLTFLFFTFRLKAFRITSKNYFLIILFIFYIFLLTLTSKEIEYSLRSTAQIILTMCMFIAGFIIIDDMAKLHRLIRSLFWVVLVSFIATGLGYIFGIGKQLEYTLMKSYQGEPEYVGLLGSGGLFGPAAILALLPLLFKEKFTRLKRWSLIISSFLLYIFIILNVRRTVILIPIIGLLIHLYYSKNRGTILKYILIGTFGILISYPLWESNQN